MNAFKNVSDVFESARLIREKLNASGEERAGKAITEIVDGFWTTSSEALIEIVTVFREIKPVWEAVADVEDRLLLSNAIDGACKLLDLQ